MADLLDGLGDIAKGAVDFLTPSTERRGGGWSIGDLINTASDTARNSVLGGVSALDDVLAGDGSAGSKLFMAGLVGLGVGGAAFGAHELAAQRKFQRQTVAPSLARWSPTAGELGLRRRFSPQTFEGEGVLRQHPGLRAKTADILGADDYVASAQHMLHDFATKDPIKVGRAGAFMKTYADGLADVPAEGRLAAAQLDFAKIDSAVDNDLLFVSKQVGKGEGYLNGEFTDLWDRFRAGDLQDPEDVQKLTQFVRQVSDATRHITEPDLSFDLVGRVERIDLTPHGAVVRTYVPNWADDQVFFNPEMRSERIRELNLRPLAARGKEFMTRLYKLGVKEQEVPGTLPRPLEKGSGWYPKAGQEIDAALPSLADVPWANKRSLTAAVSLTSKAEKWEGNVRLAQSAMRTANTPAVSDPDFQDWLRDGTFEDGAAGTGRRAYAGKKAKQHQKTFDNLHDLAKRGNQLSARDFKKVLRLASETPEDLFRSTAGRKQKNFYLNLIDPTDPVPVTIDRHMHDIFLGLASSSDFKLLEGKDIGEANYDLIGDVVREAADELGVSPNELQGVAWEAWKALKEAHRASASDPWRARNPFRLPESDGSENRVFLALQGKIGPNLSSALEMVSDRMPLVTGGEGRGVFTLPDGTLGVLAKPTAENGAQFRHLYPALMRDDGAAMYGRGAPRKVFDLEAHRTTLDNSMVGHQTESWGPGAWDELGGHPAMLAQNTIMIEGDELPRGLARYGRMFDPQMPALVSETPRARRRLRPTDLDPDSFVDREKSPLATNDFATISAFIDDDQATRFGLQGYDNEVRHRQLGQRLRRAGYRPLEQLGVYDGGSEKSYIVFGISPEEAIKIGGEFHQDSVMTNDHMWYTSKAKDPANVGKAQRFADDELNLNVSASAPFRSETTVGGRKVSWASGYTGDEPIEDIDPAGVWADRKSRRARRVAITVPYKDAYRIHEIADELEKAGTRPVAIYSPGPAPDGWKSVREHLFEDGSGLSAVRTADPEFESPHGFNVWVRPEAAEGLPTVNPEGRRLRKQVTTQQLPNGDRLVNGAVVVRGDGDLTKAPGFEVRLDGPVPQVLPYRDALLVREAEGRDGVTIVRKTRGGWVMNADPENMADAAKVADLIGQMGIEPSKLRINAGGETIDVGNVDAPRQRGWATTVMGDRVPALRRTAAPIPEWVDKYGIDFDPAWREGDSVARLPQDYMPAFAMTMDQFMARHSDMAQLVQFNRMGVQKMPKTELAHYELGGGGAIVLNADFWGNPSKMAAERKYQIATLHTSPTLGEGPEVILMHELGHVAHEALRQSFRTVAEAKEFDKTFDAMRRGFSKPALRKVLSGYAGENVNEFVAEALAEAIFSPHPRLVARDVYKLVTEQWSKNTTYRRAVGWRAAS